MFEDGPLLVYFMSTVFIRTLEVLFFATLVFSVPPQRFLVGVNLIATFTCEVLMNWKKKFSFSFIDKVLHQLINKVDVNIESETL